MADTSLPPRKAALHLLDQILGQERLMSELLQDGALEHLSGPDRARAQRLALDTLRGIERADRLLQKHLSKQPPLTVRNMLRLAVTELSQGGAPHGVVNAAVQIISAHRKYSRLKGLVNAVLRKFGDEAPALWDALRVPRLPVWLRKPLVQAWGPEAVMAMEAAHFAGAPLDLTAKGDAEALAAAVGGEVLPTGSVRLRQSVQVSALPGYEEGGFWVQDAAAALPVRLLDLKPGEAVLDLCAAPGGKTLQAAAAGANVRAVDLSEARLGRLRDNLKRCDLPAEVVTGDALEAAGTWDAIILDAPCSATGTIRRHPDLPHARQGDEIGALIELQGRMLRHAAGLLKPGGRMVYCTCSLLPDEGECQIEEALGAGLGLEIDRAALDRPGIDPSWITEEGGLRLRPDYWPERGGMDGFYMAVLRRGDPR